MAPPPTIGLKQPSCHLRTAQLSGALRTPIWGVASGDFSPYPQQLCDHFQRLSVTPGRRPPYNQLFPPSGEEGTPDHWRPSTPRAPRPRASLDRHGNSPPPRMTPARGAPLGSRQQVPRAARGLQRLPGLAAPRPARLRPGRPHSLDPGAHGPPASSWARGPRSALRCAARPPAADRPTGLPPALSPPLPPFPQAEPARSSLAPQPQPPPPPPGVNALASAGRTPWSPARVPGARLPLRLSHRHPLPPAPPPPPPPAGAAGNCSWLMGGGAREGGGVGGIGGVGGEPRISRLDSGNSVHGVFRVMAPKDLPSHCSPVETNT